MRKRTLLCGLICILLAFSALPAFAGVTLAEGNFVYFGALKHWMAYADSAPETSPSPVLWQVRNTTLDPTKPVLLTHFIVYKYVWKTDATGLTAPLSTINPNAWNTHSDLKTWLAGDQSGQFLERFSDAEKNAMSAAFATSTPADAGAKATLPATDEIGDAGLFGFSSDEGRRTTYKGAPMTQVSYWLRSAGSGTPTPSAVYVGLGGDVYLVGSRVDLEGGVRPASQISLNRIVFKSASDDFDLSPASPSAAEGGGISNPWILVLNGMSPAGWATEFASADKAPADAEIDATGKVMTVSWNVAISPAVQRWPAPGDFTLTRPGGVKSSPVSVTSSDVDDKVLILTFANAALRGESVTLDYNLNTDAISYDVTSVPGTAKVVNSFPLASTRIANNSTATSGGGGGGGGGTTPSSATTPTGVSTTVGGTKYPAEKQPDGTYLITVPAGTDVSNLPVSVGLPAGATSVPKMPASHDFTKGPLEVTVTAQDGKTKVTYTVKVQVESPAAPAEKPLFTINVADCEIIVTQNPDGTLAVKVRIPFASGSNPALLATVRMIASSLGLSNVSYNYVDANGSETPVTTLKAGAKAPYLQIAGTAANMDAVKDGVISKIEYTLKGDGKTYVQTFPNGGLKIASMPGYPSTPTPSPSTGGGSSGCDAGAMGLVALGLGCVLRLRSAHDGYNRRK